MISATIIGSLVGFAGSALGPIISYFQKKTDNKLEIDKLEKAIELARAGFTQEQTMYALTREDREHERLIAHDVAINQGSGIISALTRSVRPTITYAFFGLFVIVKWSQLDMAMSSGEAFNAAVLRIVWDNETAGLFATVLSFWFGSRVWEKKQSRR
jgi:hypothetical protein